MQRDTRFPTIAGKHAGMVTGVGEWSRSNWSQQVNRMKSASDCTITRMSNFWEFSAFIQYSMDWALNDSCA